MTNHQTDHARLDDDGAPHTRVEARLEAERRANPHTCVEENVTVKSELISDNDVTLPSLEEVFAKELSDFCFLLQAEDVRPEFVDVALNGRFHKDTAHVSATINFDQNDTIEAKTLHAATQEFLRRVRFTRENR